MALHILPFTQLSGHLTFYLKSGSFLEKYFQRDACSGLFLPILISTWRIQDRESWPLMLMCRPVQGLCRDQWEASRYKETRSVVSTVLFSPLNIIERTKFPVLHDRTEASKWLTPGDKAQGQSGANVTLTLNFQRVQLKREKYYVQDTPPPKEVPVNQKRRTGKSTSSGVVQFAKKVTLQNNEEK